MSDADQRWQDALARARRQDVLAEVGRERSRQEQLKAKGKFTYTCADAEMTDGQRLAVLVEEVGEVARAMNDGKGLREELIQVAAVAVAWVEAIDTPESRFSGHTATLTPHRLPAGTVASMGH
jgi:NTP pyrophosphatase (non-canonical NTP hydrolase)